MSAGVLDITHLLISYSEGVSWLSNSFMSERKVLKIQNHIHLYKTIIDTKILPDIYTKHVHTILDTQYIINL